MVNPERTSLALCMALAASTVACAHQQAGPPATVIVASGPLTAELEPSVPAAADGVEPKAPRVSPAARQEFNDKKVIVAPKIRKAARKGNYRGSLNAKTGTGILLVDDAFYEYVGEKGLAHQYRRRETLQLGLGVGGLVTMGIGLGVLIGGVSMSPGDCDEHGANTGERRGCGAEREAIKKRGRGVAIAGVSVFGVGAILGLVGASITAHPISAQEALELVKRHNVRLRRKLGLPVKNKHNLTLRPRFNERGAGLNLGGRF